MTATADPQDRAITRWFLIVVTAYFTLQLVMRLIHGGAYELDEAEMSVMTPAYRWGYGPQLPLYNWLQLSLFQVFGRSLFALALLKNLFLWTIYVAVFVGLRFFVPARVAVVAPAALYLVPYMAFETQRATTHSTIMLFCGALTIAAFLWAAKSGRAVAFLALGIAMTCGGISKYNYWLIPAALFLAALVLGDWRGRVFRTRALVTLIPLAFLWFPYTWMTANPDLAFASVHKLALSGGATKWTGLKEMIFAMLSMALLPVLVLALARWIGRAGAGQAGPVARLFLLASHFTALAVALGVVIADAGNVSAHWMLPWTLLFLIGVAVWLAPALSARGLRVITIAVVGLGVIVAAGLTYDRYKSGARKDVDFTGLPARIVAASGQDTPRVVGEFYLAGNLIRLRPDWAPAPYLADASRRFGGGPVVFLFRKNIPRDFAEATRLAGWPDGAAFDVVAEGVFQVPYAHTSDRMLDIPYVVAMTPVRGE